MDLQDYAARPKLQYCALFIFCENVSIDWREKFVFSLATLWNQWLKVLIWCGIIFFSVFLCRTLWMRIFEIRAFLWLKIPIKKKKNEGGGNTVEIVDFSVFHFNISRENTHGTKI